jgi:hypothetical protein
VADKASLQAKNVHMMLADALFVEEIKEWRCPLLRDHWEAKECWGLMLAPSLLRLGASRWTSTMGNSMLIWVWMQ